MDEAIADGATWPGAVAVSGGGDSLALLLLLVQWTRASARPDPVALIVDHGLRSGSAAEAAAVATRVREWNVAAHVLGRRGRKPVSDIERAARELRYRLMGAWCVRNSIHVLYVAHTLDDQAETFLLRLARGSGVDGLSAMAKVSPFPMAGFDTLRVARPLLTVSGSRLRSWLSARGESWLEDEMNRDLRFARVRLRAIWPSLEQFGLTAERVAGAARHLARARLVLERDAEQLLTEISRREDKSVVVDGSRLSAAPKEIALRALACLLMQVSGRPYRPRFERLERLFEAIRNETLGGGRTLHGCCIRTGRMRDRRIGTLRIAPEPKRRAGEARGQGDCEC